jgi:hypothetical protein
MAQLVEHVPCKHKVGGSIPPGGFKLKFLLFIFICYQFCLKKKKKKKKNLNS